MSEFHCRAVHKCFDRVNNRWIEHRWTSRKHQALPMYVCRFYMRCIEWRFVGQPKRSTRPTGPVTFVHRQCDAVDSMPFSAFPARTTARRMWVTDRLWLTAHHTNRWCCIRFEIEIWTGGKSMLFAIHVRMSEESKNALSIFNWYCSCHFQISEMTGSLLVNFTWRSCRLTWVSRPNVPWVSCRGSQMFVFDAVNCRAEAKAQVALDSPWFSSNRR